MVVLDRKYKTVSVEFDCTQLAAVLAELGLGSLASFTKLDGGGARSFRIERRNDVPLVLKAFSDALPPIEKETFAERLLSDLDVPLTRFLAADETRSRLPFCFTIANYLPGERVVLFKDEPDAAELYRQMGAMLRKLHRVALPRYGNFGEGGIVDGKVTNAEYIGECFAYSLERFCHFGGDESLAQRLGEIVAANAEVIAYSRGAVFAHDDFQPNNLLAVRDENGRLQLTGLIDFGNARASDPICDLAKALFCSEHDAPGSHAAILEGYGPIDHPDPDAAIWIYQLLHRITMWSWLRHINVIQPGTRHDLMFDLERMASESG